MLPEIRQSDYLYAVPKFELTREDMPDIAQELKGVHEYFADVKSHGGERLEKGQLL